MCERPLPLNVLPVGRKWKELRTVGRFTASGTTAGFDWLAAQKQTLY